MNYNKPVTIITQKPILQQTYNNIIITNDQACKIETEFVLIMQTFNFVDKNILYNLIDIIIHNEHLDGIYSDVIIKEFGKSIFKSNISYNNVLIKKFPPIGPLFFKNKFKSIEDVLTHGLLLHIPTVLFINE